MPEGKSDRGWESWHLRCCLARCCFARKARGVLVIRLHPAVGNTSTVASNGALGEPLRDSYSLKGPSSIVEALVIGARSRCVARICFLSPRSTSRA